MGTDPFFREVSLPSQTFVTAEHHFTGEAHEPFNYGHTGGRTRP
jgi:hypothetical protein